MKYQKLFLLFKRSLREGWKQAWRNRFLTFMTFVLGVVILFLVNVVFSVKFFIDYSLQTFEKRADFSVALREGFDSFQFDAMLNEVKKYDVSTQVLAAQDLGDFIVPQRLYIQFNAIEEVSDVLQILKNPRYDIVVGDWDSVLEEEFVSIVEKLLLLKQYIHRLSLGLVLIFILSGILLVLNTFKITAFSRRSEIGIGRVVGADTSFLVGPFVVEGIFIGLGASLVSITLYVALLAQLDFLPGGEIFEYLYNEIFYPEIGISIVVGAIGAYLSLQKYLKGSFFGQKEG